MQLVREEYGNWYVRTRARKGLKEVLQQSFMRQPVTAGQRSDYTKALDLIEGERMGALIADKGYGNKSGSRSCIPPRAMRNDPRKYDVELYKERNFIERMFNKIKNFRRVATRYDKLDVAYLAFLFLSGIYLRLK
ncbi:transposase [Alphaproteobacteria bacterium]